MKTTPKPSTFWSPQFPTPQDAKVQLLDKELQTCLSSGEPGIIIEEKYQLAAPACFWIDLEHVYLRLNWSTWSTISLSNPGQVAALCNAHHCHVYYYDNNIVSECIAPIYRIQELSRDLFGELDDDDENSLSKYDDSMTVKSEFQQNYDRISRIVENDTVGLTIFHHIHVGDYIASIMVSDNNHVLFLDFLPENRDFLFIPSNGDTKQKQMDKWPTSIISLDFIDRLRSMKKALEEQDAETIIHIGFLANSNSIELFQVFVPSEKIPDIKLFTYDNLGEQIKALFSEETNIKLLSISKRVKRIIIEHMGINESKVVEDANILYDLGADEMDCVNLIMAFKEEFDCSFPSDAFLTIHTVKDVIEFIVKQL